MYRASARNRAFFDDMMHGMPISSVAPRGSCALGASLIVSDELFRFSDSFTVAALLVDATLACFPCAVLVPCRALPLTVPGLSLEIPDTERIDGAFEVCRETGRLGAAGDASEWTDAEDAVRFVIVVGLASTGDGGGRFLTGVVLDVVDGTRGRGNLGVDVAVVRVVPVVLTLTLDMADAVEPRRLRGVTAVMSVLAVSNAVEPSLVVLDIADDGRPERADDGRRVDGPTGEETLRIVEAWDLTEAALERALDVRSPGVRLLDTLRRPGTGDRLARPEAGPWDMPERTEGEAVRWLGVSFESGRPVESAIRRVDVTVLVFEVTDRVLRATERTEALDGLTDSVFLEATLERSECMLPVSSSAFTALTRAPVLVGPL